MPIRLTKTGELDADLYPDVASAGGLTARISLALTAIGSTLEVAPETNMPMAFASVQRLQRLSQIYIGASSRIFTTDFWSHGVCLGHLATDDVEHLVRAIDFWIAQCPSTRELAARFTDVDVAPCAQEFENGTEVEARWASYLERSPHPELSALIHEAANSPELRQLFPFTSLTRLCFSRCTGYPYTRDCPVIVPAPGGRYVVHHATEYYANWEAIESKPPDQKASVDAKEAVRLAVLALPDGVGPARRGTARDL
jgi:hypothetical protein